MQDHMHPHVCRYTAVKQHVWYLAGISAEKALAYRTDS